jgi:hypothetical protein
MENTRLLPSNKLLELQIEADDLHFDKTQSKTDKKQKCVLRKKIVNSVICLCGSIIFIGFFSLIYIGKWIHQ